MDLDLIENIAKAKKGDAQAFEILYKDLYNPLFRYVLFKSKNKDAAEDIVAQTFVNWYGSLEKYEVKSKPLNYLIMIANRLMINEGLRKKVDSLDDDMADITIDESLSIESLLDIEVDFAKVKEIIENELNESERQVIELKYIFDNTNQEVSEITGKSEGNIRVIEHRALTKIRNIYNQKHKV
jgi:RNA polymerase sigma-70 factor, ECF subfamily